MSNNDGEIKWNKKRHDRKLTELETAQNEERAAKVKSKVMRMWESHKRRVQDAVAKGVVQSASDVKDTLDQLAINIKEHMEGETYRPLLDWLGSTLLVVEDASNRAGSGLLTSSKPKPEVVSPARTKLGKRNRRRR